MCTGLHEVAKVLEEVVLIVEGVGVVLWVNRHEGVLAPTPTGHSTLIQRDVPVVVGCCTVGEVVLEHRPGIARVTPIILAVATFLLCHVHPQLRMSVVDEWKCTLASPLESDALDVGASVRISKHLLHLGIVRSFHGAKEDVNPAFVHFGSEVRDEGTQAAGRPCARRKDLRRVELVLRHDHRDIDALLTVGIDETPEVGRVGNQPSSIT